GDHIELAPGGAGVPVKPRIPAPPEVPARFLLAPGTERFLLLHTSSLYNFWWEFDFFNHLCYTFKQKVND
ncbi:MAG: hypothetical protein AAB601_01130, partial [Patescibacteria group bacterium]